MNELIFLYGLPGSGLTELAEQFRKNGYIVVGPEYFFLLDMEEEHIEAAVQWSYSMLEFYLANNNKKIVINDFLPNTKHYLPYIDAALNFGPLTFQIIPSSYDWAHNVIECSKRTNLDLTPEDMKKLQNHFVPMSLIEKEIDEYILSR